jgi:hypothetical protein
MSKGGALVRFHDWRTARDHKAATRHFWRCRCIGLVAVPVSIGLATLPGLRIGALSMAAFEFAESVTLAQLIAGAECEPRAGAHAKFLERELRVADQ